MRVMMRRRAVGMHDADDEISCFSWANGDAEIMGSTRTTTVYFEAGFVLAFPLEQDRLTSEMPFYYFPPCFAPNVVALVVITTEYIAALSGSPRRLLALDRIQASAW